MLVQDSYGAVEAYLGKARGNQTREQWHQTLSNLILRRKFRKAIRFICEQDTGGVLLPINRANDRTVFMDKTVAEVLAVKYHPERKPHCYTLEVYKGSPILFRWILWRMWSSWLHGKFWGEQVPVARTWRIFRGGY